MGHFMKGDLRSLGTLAPPGTPDAIMRYLCGQGERLPGDGDYLLVDRNEMHTYLLRLTADKSEIFDGEVWKLFDDAFASTLSLSPTSAYLFYP